MYVWRAAQKERLTEYTLYEVHVVRYQRLYAANL